MNDKDLEFEKYFHKKLQEEEEIIKKLPYTLNEIKDIYKQEFERIKNMPKLELKMEAQLVDYDTVGYYLPEKWEMPRAGKLLYDDEELLNALKLIMANLGIKKSLDIIPRQLIEQYLRE